MKRSLFFASTCAALFANAASNRPNVLMIYFDDMGYGDMGAYVPTNAKIPGDSKYLDPAGKTLTPHLDKFAENALRFTNGHAANGVCSPSRYSILTGHYSWRTTLKQGVTGGYSQSFLEKDRFTIGKMFQKYGYNTAMVGKWHIGMQFYAPDGTPVKKMENNPDALQKNLIDFSKPVTATPFHRGGFDYFFGTPASLDMPPYAWLESDGKEVHVLTKGGMVVDGKVDFSQAKIAQNADLKEGKTPSRPGVYDPDFVWADYLEVQTAKVKEVIEKSDAEGKPFFIYVPMPAPHTPHVTQNRFQNSAGWRYGDYVVQTDFYANEMLKILGDPNDPNSLAANTVVFISSDNGPENGAYLGSLREKHDANGPWAGRKRDSYEGGTRVPFLVRWPGKVKAGVTDHPCWQGDFVATMADVLGHKLAPTEAPDAESFLPILNGEKMPENRRKGFIQHSVSGQFAIVDASGEWKLIDGNGGGGNKTTCDADNKESLLKGQIRSKNRQLFNLKNDPGERVNLLSDPTPEARKKADELYALLNEIRGNQTNGTEGSSNVPR